MPKVLENADESTYDPLDDRTMRKVVRAAMEYEPENQPDEKAALDATANEYAIGRAARVDRLDSATCVVVGEQPVRVTVLPDNRVSLSNVIGFDPLTMERAGALAKCLAALGIE